MMHIEYLSSEREKSQIMWGRFVNTHGRQGCNVSCDLHIEHLNQRLKGVIRNLGANQTKKAINRASKCIGVVDSICQATDSELSNKHESRQAASVPILQNLLSTEVGGNRTLGREMDERVD